MADRAPLGHDGTDLERLLLASAAGDRPDETAKDRARAALGLAAGGVAVTAVSSSQGSAPAASGSIATIKWGVAVLLGVAAAGGVYMVAGEREAAPRVVERHTEAPRSPAAPVIPPPRQAEAQDEQDVEVGTPSPAPKPNTASARPVAKQRASSASPSTLLEEVRPIDRARSALQAGDTRLAERTIVLHARRFPAGALAEEAALVAIDVAIEQGDRDELRALARRFIGRYPDSPSAPRLRKMVGLSEAEE